MHCSVQLCKVSEYCIFIEDCPKRPILKALYFSVILVCASASASANNASASANIVLCQQWKGFEEWLPPMECTSPSCNCNALLGKMHCDQCIQFSTALGCIALHPKIAHCTPMPLAPPGALAQLPACVRTSPLPPHDEPHCPSPSAPQL